MDDFQLLIDLHKRAARQGPGGEGETIMAMELAMLDPSAPLKIADIGCGTGASTLQLARWLNAQITAVDFLPEFIEVLKANAENASLTDKIKPLVGSMEDLPFDDETYDVIWSEGAIYSMGFEKGITEWQRFLKPGGVLAISEITWTTHHRPGELQRHWDAEYPEIATASAKMSVLEKNGYSPMGYFVLPEHCWLENYYRPLQNSFTEFLARQSSSEAAQAVVESERKEIALYEKYSGYYSYGFYVARKPA